jgi:CubicO group peptidase (beta-lactamase class C family)
MSKRPEWADALEAYAQGIMATYDCPGMGIGIARGGELRYFGGFGHRDREQGLPVTEQTVMGIASCSKSFTAVAIMQLQEAGKLCVHHPVVRYLPEFHTADPVATGKITLHHLLTHTTGLPPLFTLWHTMLESMRNDPARSPGLKPDEMHPITSFAQVLEFIGANCPPLLGPPGTCFSYSSDSYSLLGAVIERLSGMTYEAYVTERILVPAKMTDTTFDQENVAGLPDVATLYAVRPRPEAEGETEVYPAPLRWEMGRFNAGGGLRSTVRDMLRYTEIYRAGGLVGQTRILSPASVAAMVHPYAEVDESTHYGYGLMIRPYHGVTLVEHGGSLKGVAANFTIIPEKGLTGVGLNNLGGVPTAQVLLGALNLELGLPMDTRRVTYGEYACPTERLALYAGEYVSGEGSVLTISPQEDGLLVEATGLYSSRVEVRPRAEHLFVGQIKETELAYRFLLNGEGEVDAVHTGLRMIRKRR